MTPSSIKNYIDAIIQREGSKYTNHPKDRGGPTKFGITLKTLSDFRDDECTAKDVENLTENEARAIYQTNYITGPKFDLLNDEAVAGLMIDWGVMSGPQTAIMQLQKVVSAYGHPLKIDGILGPITAGAANSFPRAAVLRNALVDAKILFHVRDCKANPEQLVFLEGWINRTLTFRSNS